MTTRLFRLLLIACGTLSVGLGVVGIFVPLMPTTVFLLLGAACYARSSERHYRRLLQNRWLGPYIRNSREGHGMTRRHKIGTIALLWAGIGATCVWSVEAWWLRSLLVLIAFSVTIHVARIRVAPVAVRETTDVPA
jgi:uncharacterized membrane protein YbaN (DUF454 family)